MIFYGRCCLHQDDKSDNVSNEIGHEPNRFLIGSLTGLAGIIFYGRD